MSTAGRAVCGVSGALFTWGKGCISDRRPREQAVCISQVVLPFEFRHNYVVCSRYLSVSRVFVMVGQRREVFADLVESLKERKGVQCHSIEVFRGTWLGIPLQ